MRATISFETDVDQVEGTMAVIACEEEHNLRAAADILGNYTVLDGSLLDAITEVLRVLDSSTEQLRQYQQMLVSFEKARFETMLPQSAPATVPVTAKSIGETVRAIKEAQNQSAQMEMFNKFINRIDKEEEESDGLQTQEG
jgi:uncharacterized protein Yka (UPF0111/DUF47 family)